MKFIAKKLSAKVGAVIALTTVGAVLSAALVASLAGANPATTDTTAVSLVDIPAKQVWGSNSVSPGRAESVVVIGGTTTVPTNATTVRLQVTVKGAAAGTLRFYPAGNETGGAGHTLSWAAGGTNTGTTNENVGMQNKVSVFNDSTKAAVVTVKITGYSTQVTAGDINGSGGSAGQVLTTNGAGGVRWATPGAATLPTAFALVNWDGVVSDFHPSRGLTSANVTRSPEFQGSYCISGLDFTPLAVSLTPSTRLSGRSDVHGQIGLGHGCDTGTQVSVQVSSTSSNTPEWGTFNIVLWGE